MEAQVERFLDHLLERGCGENTVLAYRSDLNKFRVYLQGSPLGSNFFWKEVTKDRVAAFIAYLQTNNYSNATIARRLAAIKSFFKFLKAAGIINDNPLEKMRALRFERHLPKPLSIIDVEKILAGPAKSTSPLSLRDRALLEVLYATGMRVTELVSLDIGSVQIEGINPTVCCLGSRRERVIPIHRTAVQALEFYLARGRPLLMRNPREKALFINRRGKRLTRQGFWFLLKGYAHKAAITSSVSPHTLRHSFAIHMIRGGTPVRMVQQLLGHAVVATTQIYTKVPDVDMRTSYESAHPRS